MTSKLEELALWCEQASGPDRKLDQTIWFTLFGPDKDMKRMIERGSFNYTASLDASMTALPEDRDWMLDNFDGSFDRRCTATVFNAKGDPHAEYEAIGATPALALCAAALRARAQQEAAHGKD